MGKYFSQLEVKIFPNKEIKIRPLKNVRWKKVYIIWGLTGYEEGDIDPNAQLMGLYIANDAAKRSAAARITDVIPFLPYMRQDRKDEGRAPITGSMVMALLKRSGARTMVTVDLHTKQAEGFFDGPADNLQAMPLFADEIFGRDKIDPDEWVIMGPDMGAMVLARKYKEWVQKRYGYDIRLGVTDKTRSEDGKTKVQYVIGDVKGRNVFIPDDMIDSGSSVLGGALKIREKGAKRIVVAGTHGLFSRKDGKKAEEKLRKADITVMTTDSVPRAVGYLEENSDWLKVRSLVPLLAEAISELDKPDGSLSRLYDPTAELGYL